MVCHVWCVRALDGRLSVSAWGGETPPNRSVPRSPLNRGVVAGVRGADDLSDFKISDVA